MAQRTKEEILQLIEVWEKERTWILEDSEGFETHREELTAHRLKKEAEWRASEEAWEALDRCRLLARFDRIGIVGLMRHLEAHEAEIENLKRAVARLSRKRTERRPDRSDSED